MLIWLVSLSQHKDTQNLAAEMLAKVQNVIEDERRIIKQERACLDAEQRELAAGQEAYVPQNAWLPCPEPSWQRGLLTYLLGCLFTFWTPKRATPLRRLWRLRCALQRALGIIPSANKTRNSLLLDSLLFDTPSLCTVQHVLGDSFFFF